MKIEFCEHHVDHVGQIYLATDSNEHDVFLNQIRTSSDLTNTNIIRYMLQALEKKIFHAPPKFIDVGANIGTCTLPIAKSGAKTLAIEALPQNVTLLSESIKKNKLNNVTVVHCAASDQPGILKMKGSSAWGQINKDGYGTAVPALTIDTLAQINDFLDAKLIKIDVEGAELSVFAGMENLLSSNNDIEILFESNTYACASYNHSPKKLKAFFSSLGYNIYRFKDMELIPVSDTDTQEIIIVDYLATKKTPHVKNFKIKSLSLDETIHLMTTDAKGSAFQAAYFLTILEDSPTSIKNDKRIKETYTEIESKNYAEMDQIKKWIRLAI